MPQTSKKGRLHLKLEDFQYDGLKAREKYEIVERRRDMVSANNKISTKAVWITLKHGSLIVHGDVDEIEGAQWPTEGEVRAIVQELH